MRTLLKIYKEAGLTSPFNFKNKTKFSSDYEKIKLNQSEDFYYNKIIVKKVFKKEYRSKLLNNKYFSIEGINNNDLYYSSKIEGIDIKKESKANPSVKEIWNKAYLLLNQFESIDVDSINEIVEILESDNNVTLSEKMREDNSLYRKNRVGVYSFGKYGEGELVHEGMDSKLISESIKNIIPFQNNVDCDFNELIINVSIAHLLFEYIHPYYDGNGRLGRMLILWMTNNSNYPGSGYSISELIYMNKSKYYNALNHSQTTKDLTYFIVFMNEIMTESLKVNNLMMNIIDEYEDVLTNTQFYFIRKLLHSGMMNKSVNYPSIKSNFEDHTRQGFNKMIKILEEMELLIIDRSQKTHSISLNNNVIH